MLDAYTTLFRTSTVGIYLQFTFTSSGYIIFMHIILRVAPELNRRRTVKGNSVIVTG